MRSVQLMKDIIRIFKDLLIVSLVYIKGILIFSVFMRKIKQGRKNMSQFEEKDL